MTGRPTDAAPRTATGRPLLENPYDSAPRRGSGPARVLRTLAGATVVTGTAIAMSGTAAADVDDLSGLVGDSSDSGGAAGVPDTLHVPLDPPGLSVGTPDTTPSEVATSHGPTDPGATMPTTPGYSPAGAAPYPEQSTAAASAPSVPVFVPRPPAAVGPPPADVVTPVTDELATVDPSTGAPVVPEPPQVSEVPGTAVPTGTVPTPGAAVVADVTPTPVIDAASGDGPVAGNVAPSPVGVLADPYPAAPATEAPALVEQFGATDEDTTAALDAFVNGDPGDPATEPASPPDPTIPADLAAWDAADDLAPGPPDRAPGAVLDASAAAPPDHLPPTPPVEPTPDAAGVLVEGTPVVPGPSDRPPGRSDAATGAPTPAVAVTDTAEGGPAGGPADPPGWWTVLPPTDPDPTPDILVPVDGVPAAVAASPALTGGGVPTAPAPDRPWVGPTATALTTGSPMAGPGEKTVPPGPDLLGSGGPERHTSTGPTWSGPAAPDTAGPPVIVTATPAPVAPDESAVRGGDDYWEILKPPEEPALVVTPGTALEGVRRDPVRGPMIDHLAGEGRNALEELWNLDNRIGSETDWHETVVAVASILRRLSLDAPHMTPARVLELFPTGPRPVDADLVGRPPLDPELAEIPHPPFTNGVQGLTGVGNEEAQHLLVGGGHSGLTSVELGCWVVCHPDGSARVMPELYVGLPSYIRSSRRPLAALPLSGVRYIDYVHTHPFFGNTAGLSDGDRNSAAGDLRFLEAFGAHAEPGMNSIDLLTGTVVRGVVDPTTGEWARLQAFQSAGPIVDEVLVGGKGVATAGAAVEKPLGPVDIVTRGTSGRLDDRVRGILRPEETVQQRFQQLDDMMEIVTFDARLSGSVAAQGTPDEVPEQDPGPSGGTDERGEAEGPRTPRPRTDSSTDQDVSVQSPGPVRPVTPSGGQGAGVVFAPDPPSWDPDLGPNRANEGLRPAPPEVGARPAPPERYDPGNLGGFGDGPSPWWPSHTGTPRPETGDLENHVTRFPMRPEDFEGGRGDRPAPDPQPAPNPVPSRRVVSAPIPSDTVGWRTSPALAAPPSPVPPVRTGPPVRRPGSRYPLCGSGVTTGCIDPTSLRDVDGDGVADNTGTPILGGIVGPRLVGREPVGPRLVGSKPAGRESIGTGSVTPDPRPAVRPQRTPQQPVAPQRRAGAPRQAAAPPRTAARPQLATAPQRTATQQQAPRPGIEPRTVAPQPVTRQGATPLPPPQPATTPRPVRRPDLFERAATAADQAVRTATRWVEEKIVTPLRGVARDIQAGGGQIAAMTVDSVEALDGSPLDSPTRYRVTLGNGAVGIYAPDGPRIQIVRGSPPASLSPATLRARALFRGGMFPGQAGSGGQALPRSAPVLVR